MSDRPVPSFLEHMPLARRALAYADALHHGQRRESDRAPFILHPLEVASLLHTTGHSEELITAAIVHDAIEKTAATGNDLADRFGRHVAEIVVTLTKDPSAPSGEGRKKLRRQVDAYGDGAIAVFAADKVAKVRELRAEATKDRGVLADGSEGRHRLDHYVASLALLEDKAAEHPIVGQLRFELEALDMLPPLAT